MHDSDHGSDHSDTRWIRRFMTLTNGVGALQSEPRHAAFVNRNPGRGCSDDPGQSPHRSWLLCHAQILIGDVGNLPPHGVQNPDTWDSYNFRRFRKPFCIAVVTVDAGTFPTIIFVFRLHFGTRPTFSDRVPSKTILPVTNNKPRSRPEPSPSDV